MLSAKNLNISTTVNFTILQGARYLKTLIFHCAYIPQKVHCQADCALTRVYRLLHNPRLDDLVISRQMIRTLARRSSSVLIALDWTEWHPPLRMLLASVVAGTRAVPVQTAVFRKTSIVRSQNCWENTFLQMLVMILKEAGVVACFLADRGFRRVSFIQLLLRQTGHTFLVRLAEKVQVQTKRGGMTLQKWGLQPGRAVDLGWVDVRQDAAVRVRVVGIWAKGRREPWWLATNCPDSLSRLVSLYDRRMAIEEQIRDTKGARSGFALVWTQIKTPEALARFVLLIGLAVLVLTAVGHAVSGAPSLDPNTLENQGAAPFVSLDRVNPLAPPPTKTRHHLTIP